MNGDLPIRRRLLAALFQPVDIISLVFFRLAFGAVALWEVTRYLSQDWVREIWIEPDFFFGYPFFEWVKPWPGNGMILHFWGLGVLAALIMVGAFYRLAAALFFLGFTYVFLLEQSHYLNHFYLISLISFLLVFLPANRKLSIDALLRPSIRSETVSSWAVWLLRFQVGLPYFFGGLAKINSDWLQGEPMRYWLQGKGALPVVGPFLGQPWAAYFFSYGGLFLDLFAVPLLLWRRTRVWAFLVTTLFHVANDAMFQIGIFPWFMIAATTIFFEPDWPQRLMADWGARPSWRGVVAGLGAALGAVVVVVTQAAVRDGLPVVPLLIGATAGALIAWSLSARLGTREPAAASDSTQGAKKRATSSTVSRETPVGGLRTSQALGASLLVVWAAVQVVVPLRHYLIPGDVNWTEEGHRFSWHMMLRTKQGAIRYEVIDPADGTVWEIDPSSMLTPRQAYTVPGRADMIRLFAQHLASEFAARGRPNVEVRALTNVTLNGREPQPFVNPDVDLTREPVRLWGTPWILPLTQPLPAH